MDRWIGRVAIVTGASSGIGATIAQILAEKGMKVVGVARRVDRIQDLSEKLKICKLGSKIGELHAIQGDVSKEEDIIRVVKWTRDNLGGADVLVNNAGIFRSSPLPEPKTEDIRDMFDVNVVGLCLFTREVIKDMRDRKVDDGHIFHIGSISGQKIISFPGVYLYSATKHSVRVLTEGLRRELRDLGTKIRVTEISPGLVRTDVLEAAGILTREQINDLYKNTVCLEPEDVANALLYALSTPPHVQVHEITIQPNGEMQ